ncbi:LYR motif-containing protein 2 [Polychytrium aggregatum]|uniref:LYR motif-containing protein 2 n=1 Tax=Polychytrium aggregatum TaxID=110093 RepID=UPI0022FDEAC0|nr:LYR motif-containing protein 2 [Polychytrium aggregatum]KAI9193707.1 LYR motif-containing protein 2 [Polychytrium aggregatum]
MSASRFAGKNIPTLQQFMTKQKVLSLYREILRATKGLPQDDAEFIRSWARSDFERYRTVTDPDRIQLLLSQGKVQLRTLEKSVTFSKVK